MCSGRTLGSFVARVQNCPGILGLEQGIGAEIAVSLPSVPCSGNFCQLLVWRTGA